MPTSPRPRTRQCPAAAGYRSARGRRRRPSRCWPDQVDRVLAMAAPRTGLPDGHNWVRTSGPSLRAAQASWRIYLSDPCQIGCPRDASNGLSSGIPTPWTVADHPAERQVLRPRSRTLHAAEQLAALLRSLTGRWMRFTRCSSPTSLRSRADEVANQPIYVIFEGHHSCCESKLSDAIQPDAGNIRIHK